MLRKLILGSLLLVVPGLASAQSGVISGYVTEDGRSLPLPSATVRVVGTSWGALTDSDGYFRISRVSAGSYQVEVIYIGYESATVDVSVQPGKTAEVKVSLKEKLLQLDEITVYGEATRGQAEALQKQKTSLNIKNVVSEELFSRFPDRNAAETVRRLPGISVDRDQGEGEFVQIRGIDQEYNSLTMNGVRMPAPDPGEGRAVGLDLINNKLLSEVEVIKAVTPDMDGDAIGGVVNFGLRTAPAAGLAEVNVGLGLNGQASDFETYGRDIQDVSVVAGRRSQDGKVGIIVDGAYYKTNRDSKLREFEYDDGDGSIDEVIFAQHTNDYDVRRQRYGFGGTVDYKANPESRIYASASYNIYKDDEVRRIVDYQIEDQNEERETRNRVEDQRLSMLMAGGDHDLGKVAIDYKAAWIKASEDMPDRTYLRYERDNPFTGFSNEQVKTFDGTTTFSGLAPATLNRIRYDDNLKEDEDLSAQLNLAIPFALGEGASEIKLGGKLLRKNVSFDRNRFQMTNFNGPAPTLQEGTFGFEDVRYNDPELASILTTWSERDNKTDSYDASEDVSSVYGLVTLDLNEQLSFLAGGRYEDTKTDYTQPFPETQNTPLTGEGGYGNFLPSAHLTYRPDDNSNVRAAFTTGIARPRYDDLVPRRVVDDDDLTISYGNPDLEPRDAYNFDLMYERFTEGLGFFGAGFFYKHLNAFHTTRVFTEQIGGVDYTASQTVMGEGTAKFAGLEVAFNQRLGLLGPGLTDFSLFGTYNYTWSEGEQGGREIPLTNSPKHTANLSLLYDNSRLGLSFVVAANYRDALLIGVGNAPHRDVYFDSEFHLDFSFVKTLSKQMTVSA